MSMLGCINEPIEMLLESALKVGSITNVIPLIFV
jgi:hypothetical protein